MHVDKKEQENKIIDNMRSMMASLSQSIKKSIKKYHKLIIKNQKINSQTTWDLWQIHYHSLLIKYQRFIIKYHKLMKKNKKINL